MGKVTPGERRGARGLTISQRSVSREDRLNKVAVAREEETGKVEDEKYTVVGR